MAEDGGRLEVKVIFSDSGLIIALARVNDNLMGFAQQAKAVTNDYVRLT